jgi:hypothetical protein
MRPGRLPTHAHAPRAYLMIGPSTRNTNNNVGRRLLHERSYVFWFRHQEFHQRVTPKVSLPFGGRKAAQRLSASATLLTLSTEFLPVLSCLESALITSVLVELVFMDAQEVPDLPTGT